MQRVVFRAGGRQYSWADVIASAKARGAWAELTQRPLAEPALADRSSLSRWRRARGLLSADETVAWLEHWELELVDLERYLGIRDHSRAASLDPDRVGWVRAVCSGAHKTLAGELAARIALAPDPPGAEAELDHDALERAYEARRRDIETHDLPRLLEERAEDWIRIRMSCVSLTGDDQAREAMLCLRVDGMTITEVAAMSGTAVVESSAFVDELDAELRSRALGSVAGDLLGPFATDSGQYRVVQIVARGADIADPDVLARTRSVAIEEAIARSPVRLEWHERL